VTDFGPVQGHDHHVIGQAADFEHAEFQVVDFGQERLPISKGGNQAAISSSRCFQTDIRARTRSSMRASVCSGVGVMRSRSV
ncbi:hypothetical protein DF186_22085, partial [Enterococcus hirae]